MSASGRPRAYETLVADVCRVLGEHGNRLPLRVVADAIAAPTDEVRRQVEAFTDIEGDRATAQYSGDHYHLVIDPADDVSDHPAPSDDDWLVLNVTSPRILGVEQFDADVLGPLYVAAEQLLAEEPDNETLQEATATLRQRFLPGALRMRQFRGSRVAELRRAIAQSRRVRIVYSRAWEPGVTPRTIEPYELLNTARGAEVDAGPVDDDGEIRTFLISRIREMAVLDETFQRPADAAERSLAKRALTPVSGFVPHEDRWVLDKWAERVQTDAADGVGYAPAGVGGDARAGANPARAATRGHAHAGAGDDGRAAARDDAQAPEDAAGAMRAGGEAAAGNVHVPAGVRFTAELLPPVEWRCALMMLLAGRDAFLDDPALDAARADLATRLLVHHGLA